MNPFRFASATDVDMAIATMRCSALEQAPIQIDHVYATPQENHNPMKPHATIARWDGDMLTVYDANQGVDVAPLRSHASTFKSRLL